MCVLFVSCLWLVFVLFVPRLCLVRVVVCVVNVLFVICLCVGCVVNVLFVSFACSVVLVVC